MAKHPDTLSVALDALAKGYAPVPCDGKVPLVKWKELQTRLPTAEQVREWFRDPRHNIAILCTGLVVFDIDIPGLIDLVIGMCGDTPHKLRTPSGGVHLGYRRRTGVVLGNHVRIKRSKKNPDGLPIDIRTNGGIGVIAPSKTAKGEYRWLDGCGLRPASELPVAKIAWTRPRKRTPRPVLTGELPAGAGRIVGPERYCLSIPSVQGANGSRALVRVVCIFREARRTPGQTFDYLTHVYNAACCDPPWSERELWHCIRRHYGLT